ncbi:antibiotic biosynthesis monooxygenase [Weissella paramesenteroides]|uniref:putative quinol monooxygenase n=1 Tax=Weissella paramesenteroides TaxID=1249 RepID=UPI001238D75B|nr:putative quinol monooxygenase [Weissella paramesenteroides]KAA8438320.1 antibiotic biosynthesis monooxygenase [Weissella paramesenteroides]KAA8440283.1 antibiotic biosynthesis monooxygenase [Weissella paramesenteroides]KAA8440387.1 antibiotic biosynthesis monooxygenase [Weissella paramesenteroides]KAA8445127.1 antibiotic biosynthesis monooxygenase [Weissella paramesenteroides]KAA8448303.1 antibiotic biosynthesis monooxygenase [Weissella paramesenteroides]
MSLTVNLYYTGTNGAAQKFVQEMLNQGIVDKIRSEKGNLKYNYFTSLDNPETILLIDSWENQTALDKHHASQMMQDLAQLREKYDLHMYVERYLDDPTDDSHDAKFIRK